MERLFHEVAGVELRVVQSSSLDVASSVAEILEVVNPADFVESLHDTSSNDVSRHRVASNHYALVET